MRIFCINQMQKEESSGILDALNLYSHSFFLKIKKKKIYEMVRRWT